MPTVDDYVSRNEFNMLMTRVQSNETRIENIDRDGSRGVLAVQERLTDAIKDISDLRIDLNSFKVDTANQFQKQEQAREREHQERRSERHWVIGSIIALIGSMGGIYAFLLDISHHIH